MQKGIKKQIELGEWLGNRYNTLFGSTYSSKNIYAVSNDLNRTIQSALMTFKGIYTETYTEKSIKVDVLIKEKDNIIKTSKQCPIQRKLVDQLLKSKAFRDMEDPELYSYLRNHSKMPIHNLEFAFYLHDNLAAEEENDLILPDWTKHVYPGKLGQQALFYLLKDTFTDDLTRFSVGPLWYKVTQFWKSLVSNPNVSAKVLMISGQEYTLVNILNSIEAFDYKSPPVSSCVIFELREKNNQHYIRAHYKVNNQLKSINFRNCSTDCNLVQVLEILQPISTSPQEWDTECYDDGTPYKVYISGGVMLIVAVICLFSYVVYKKSRKHFELVRDDEIGKKVDSI